VPEPVLIKPEQRKCFEMATMTDRITTPKADEKPCFCNGQPIPPKEVMIIEKPVFVEAP
jgi:hypothetical protein